MRFLHELPSARQLRESHGKLAESHWPGARPFSAAAFAGVPENPAGSELRSGEAGEPAGSGEDLSSAEATVGPESLEFLEGLQLPIMADFPMTEAGDSTIAGGWAQPGNGSAQEGLFCP